MRAALASRGPRLPRYAYALPAAFLAAHVGLQYLRPSDADQWQQYNLPHKLLASALSSGQLAVEDWLAGDRPDTPPDVAGLNQLDLSERRCWPAEDARATS